MNVRARTITIFMLISSSYVPELDATVILINSRVYNYTYAAIFPPAPKTKQPLADDHQVAIDASETLHYIRRSIANFVLQRQLLKLGAKMYLYVDFVSMLWFIFFIT